MITFERANERCSLWFKDTKMKANHNKVIVLIVPSDAVPYGSKILK